MKEAALAKTQTGGARDEKSAAWEKRRKSGGAGKREAASRGLLQAREGKTLKKRKEKSSLKGGARKSKVVGTVFFLRVDRTGN